MAEFLSVNSTYTGGASILSYAVSGAWTLSRAVSGATPIYTPIGSGNYVGSGVTIDIGDGLPGPLDPTAFYLYQLADTIGTVTSLAVQPANAVNLEVEPLTMMLIRLFQGAINGAVANGSIPSGVAPPNRVLLAMPIGGLPAFPIITINLDLLQQTEIPIGQSFPWVNQKDGSFVLFGNAKRIFTISVLAADAITRDFYREALTRWWLVIVATVLTKIGQNVGHRYQVASGQVSKDERMPGFYYADLMAELNGAFNVDIAPGFGLIQTITVSAGSNGLVDEIIADQETV